MALVNAVIDSLGAIAKGSIGVAAGFVENALAKAVPVAIGFLASLLGLGDPSKPVQGFIEKARAPVNKAIDWVINLVARGVKTLFGKVKTVAGKMMEWWKKRIGFKTKSGASHSIFTDGEPSNIRIAVQSEKIYLEEAIKLITDQTKKGAASKLLGSINGYMTSLKKLQSKENKSKEENDKVKSLSSDLDRALREMSDILSEAGVLEKTAAGKADGSRSKPYDITWQKPPLANYKSFWLAPKDMVKGRTSQEDIRKIDGSKEYSPTAFKAVPGGSEIIGVAPMYQTRMNLVVGPKRSGGSTRKGVKAFNSLLEAHGYDRKGDGETDGDHVVELQVSGIDATPNLWPLNSGQNRSGGSSLNNLDVTIEDGSKKKVKDLEGKFFKIVGFKT
jgi:hypothetical protein